jgi:hypothetical protein
MTQLLSEATDWFTDPHDELQLRLLDELLQSAATQSLGHREYRALFGIFERFPSEDGFGVFWGIIHCMESCNGYEPDLIASVLRKPVEFNILMVNRLLNTGVLDIDGQPLMSVLASVASNPAATRDAKYSAERFISHQRQQGRTES